MEPVFTFKNVQLGYRADLPVLEIDEMEIPSGKMIFLLGKSGVGKSTILEFLGLMNNTLLPQADSSVVFRSGDKQVDYGNLWKASASEMSDFRNRYFSFIFQSDNLMQNFTAGENICFTQMIQGVSYDDARDKAINLMEALQLDTSKFDSSVLDFSGGQKQRLSFIRAIAKNYSILFCDEPTGNLDWNNASNLMQVLKSDLQKKNATAIIVSHDVPLALEYADMIYLLSAKPLNGASERVIGQIQVDHIFNADHWQNDPAAFKSFIENALR